MSSKTDAVVKLGIVFSIALLSFSIGIFAGKKFSDNQHALAILEPNKKSGQADREVASTSSERAPEARSGAMTDEEIAKLAEEFVADETVPAHSAASEEHPVEGHDPLTKPAIHEPPKKAGTHGPASEGPATPSAAHTEPSSAAKNVAAGKAPAEVTTETKKATTTESRVPSSLPKDVAQFSVGKFTVQVAAYPVESEAQKMASDLKSKGYNAFYIPASVKGQTFYRVSVGQFATQKEAQSYRTEFLEKSKLSSAIVQKIAQ